MDENQQVYITLTTGNFVKYLPNYNYQKIFHCSYMRILKFSSSTESLVSHRPTPSAGYPSVSFLVVMETNLPLLVGRPLMVTI